MNYSFYLYIKFKLDFLKSIYKGMNKIKTILLKQEQSKQNG